LFASRPLELALQFRGSLRFALREKLLFLPDVFRDRPRFGLRHAAAARRR
jgi:hypothetical protein